MPYKDPEKQKEYQRLRAAKCRAEFFKDKFCVECGSVTKLELDHIDRTNKISHNIWSWSLERRNSELLKCQVLCHVCHMVKTSIENSGHEPYQHGTRNMYEYHLCRCPECRQWRSDKRKRLKKIKSNKICRDRLVVGHMVLNHATGVQFPVTVLTTSSSAW